jgi:hypothetical protein
LTTSVMPSPGSRSTAEPTGMLPIAMRSPSTQERPARPRRGP